MKDSWTTTFSTQVDEALKETAREEGIGSANRELIDECVLVAISWAVSRFLSYYSLCVWWTSESKADIHDTYIVPTYIVHTWYIYMIHAWYIHLHAWHCFTKSRIPCWGSTGESHHHQHRPSIPLSQLNYFLNYLPKSIQIVPARAVSGDCFKQQRS